MIDVIWDHVAPYGWFITFMVFATYFLYKSLMRPKLDKMREAEELAQKKKFDEDVHARVAVKLEEARRAQQMHHDSVAEQAKRQAEEAARKKLELAEKELRKKGVLESTLLERELKLHENRAGTAVKQQSPAEIIDTFIASKPIVIFSKMSCPFCRKAKAAIATFRPEKERFVYIELDQRPDLPGDAIQDEFQKRYGSRSVPKVFIGGKFIGSGDDVVHLLHTGELEVLVQKALE